MDLVIPDQFFDRTKGRDHDVLRRRPGRARRLRAPVLRAARATSPTTPRTAAGATVHKGGTYVCMEGPQFSTLAESKLYRSWGMDIIGMTNLQEAKLAREAEICYATIALVTDYDCWHPDHDSGDGRHDHRQPGRRTRRPRSRSSPRPSTRLPFERTCECATALKHAHHHAARRRSPRDRAESQGPARRHASATVPHANSMSIIVTGSIAYDYLMSFPGKFTEHFLPEHMNRVSLSFLVDTMDKRRGGCAPNIAYTLALLGERPRLMAHGRAGLRRVPPLARGGRRRHLAGEAGRATSSRRRSSAAPTPRATRSRRSTPARWRTPASCRSAPSPDARLAIISPNDPAAMVQYAEECRTLEHPVHLGSGPAVRAHVGRRAGGRHRRAPRSSSATTTSSS